MTFDPNAIGERHDRGGGDQALIDPGPIQRTDVRGEQEAREALRASKPEPIQRKGKR